MILRYIRNFSRTVYKDVYIDRYVYCGALLFIVLLAIVGFSRQLFNYGVETDFIKIFVPEAKRFLNLEPLRIDYHPPFFSITLALLYLIVGDWFVSGLIISLLSALIAILVTYYFFKLKFGELEAIGAILALMFSWTFISHSMQASSDIFFWALFFSALSAVAFADAGNKKYLWTISGTLIGLTSITRANGIAALIGILFAVLSVNKIISPKKKMVLILIGIIIPIAAWTFLSKIYQSPIFPKFNYVDLAANYFPDDEDRFADGDFPVTSEEFESLWQVLAKDPQKIFKMYLKDLYQNTKSIFTDNDLLPFPYILLAASGLLLLFFVKFDKFKLGILIVLLCMFFLTNFHFWMDRAYLFVVPFLGAGSMAFLIHLHKLLRKNIFIMLLTFLVFISILNFSDNVKNGYIGLFKKGIAWDAFSAAQTILNKKFSSEAIVFTRKPHIAYFAKAKRIQFPKVKTIEDLKKSIKCENLYSADHPSVFLFYGLKEKIYRPYLIDLTSPKFYVPWLKRIDSGPENGGWVLFEIIGDKL